ncbi:aromatic amino acid ammonia-lyase [Bacillus gobiensis]|uniref:HAL/PAL/TAL family ammonia-lyase n=1 Tax=Bacillus gobiensis TaxID=1441095 RepID=UPI003D1F95C8
MGDVLQLDGTNLTIEDIYSVAREKKRIEIDETAKQKVINSRKLIYKLVDKNIPVYGFNRGVGLNKDKVIDTHFFEKYNRNLILSHCAGVKPEAAQDEVRAVMLARLNGLLIGCTGTHPKVVERYADFLNLGIHPVLPLRGSIGAADITTISHIGLTMIGEGEVEVSGAKYSAYLALEKSGLKPLNLGPKDGLAIVSSNALSAGTGALALYDCRKLLEIADIVYALSLEAIRGNVSPLNDSVHRMRSFPGQIQSLKNIQKMLKDSDLWTKHNPDSLQDPLSFRNVCQIHGAALDASHYTREQLERHLNSSDDNPCVLTEEGTILSCGNFEPIAWTIGFEMLGNALHHVTKSSCFRTIKLGDPAFTGLTRFLTPDEKQYLGFCTMQKTVSALDAEIRHLSNFASSDYISLAGDIEDHGTNAPYVVSKTREIIDRAVYILGIEALHAAQAIDLRGGLRLGRGTAAAYHAIRSVVPFLDKDRNLSADIERIYQLFKTGELLDQVRKNYKD